MHARRSMTVKQLRNVRGVMRVGQLNGIGLGCGCEGRIPPARIVGQLRSRGKGQSMLAGLGSAQFDGAIKGASAGATVGSVVPVIGTAIGAVVGAIAGAIFGGKKAPVRPSAQDVTASTQFAAAYTQGAGSVPGRVLGLANIHDVFIALTVIRKICLGQDPRFFEGYWGAILKTVQDFVDAIKSAAPGAQVTLTDPGATGRKGKTVTIANPGLVPGAVAGVLADFYDAIAKDHKTKPCHHDPIVLQFLTDLVDAVEDSKGVAVPAELAAPDGTQATGQPPAVLTPPSSSLIDSGLLPPAAASDATQIIQQMLAQGASQQDAVNAALQKLQAGGIAPTQSVADALTTQAAGGSGVFGIPTNTLLIGGAIAVTAFFLLKRKGR